MPKYANAAILASVIAILLSLLVRALMPPNVETYMSISKNKDGSNRVVLDKRGLEAIRYAPAVEFLMWALKPLAERYFSFDVATLLKEARALAKVPGNTTFWHDLEEKEILPPIAPETKRYENIFWMKHLKLVVESIESESARRYQSPFGRMLLHDDIVNNLAVQLKVMNLVRTHPEILQEPIIKPVIVTGQQRTMTTHGQSILCAREDVHCIRFFDGMSPIEPTGEIPPQDIGTVKDPRVKKLMGAEFFVSYLRPLFPLMFKVGPFAPYEDVGIQTASFGSPEFFPKSYMPKYVDYWQDERLSKASSYRFLKLVQQVIQWQRVQRLGPGERNKRWIMKTPEHAGFLRDLLKVYPDARVMLTHRDPLEAVPSYVPLVLYINGFWNNHQNATEFGTYVLAMSVRHLDRLAEQIDEVPAEQVVHIPFKHFVKDNYAVVTKVCEFAELPMDPVNSKLMKDFITHSPREGANKLEYRLETLSEDGTFAPENIRKLFRKYSEKFKEYI